MKIFKEGNETLSKSRCKHYFLWGSVEQPLEMAISQIIAVCRTALTAYPPGPLVEPLNPATAGRLSWNCRHLRWLMSPLHWTLVPCVAKFKQFQAQQNMGQGDCCRIATRVFDRMTGMQCACHSWHQLWLIVCNNTADMNTCQPLPLLPKAVTWLWTNTTLSSPFLLLLLSKLYLSHLMSTFTGERELEGGMKNNRALMIVSYQ